MNSLVSKSRHFVEVIRGVKPKLDDFLVSFDVASLFTNVPIHEAVDEICRRLQNHETLNERTALQPTALQACYNCVFIPPIFVSMTKSMSKERELHRVHLYQQWWPICI